MTKLLKKYLSFTDRHATGKVVLILFIITMASYVFMLAYTIPEVMDFANGMKILDMMPLGYSSEYVHILLETLGEDGRDYYLYRQIPADTIYPFMFMLGYSFLLGYIFKKSFKPHH